MNLEVSEETHERKDLIVVGTAIVKGENITSRGNIYIFDVVDVVPEPGVPETDLKLKLVAKEEVKGAVTALSPIGSQGFLLAAQGQKCMVRGLKEDLSILPVAFMDMRYYVKVAKELRGTGLCILGDAISGLWFIGYSVCLQSPTNLTSMLTEVGVNRRSHTKCNCLDEIR
jgi:cleavage and polyadenylation specificity factor subunit 1